MIDPEWILQLRSETLTGFLMLFPLLTSGIFYISIIALGFWLRPGGTTFIQLGFLVPFSTIINLILKNSFTILRPHEDMHMLPVESILGFPSGDVQVAVVAWGVFYLRWPQKYLKGLIIAVISLIMLSRIYFGVHSIADVVAGLFFGLIILLWWKLNVTQSIFFSWFKDRRSSYWGLCIITILLYFLTVDDDIYSSMFITSAGTLLGFGLSLKYISRWHYIPVMFSGKHVESIALSYMMLVMLTKIIPSIQISETTKIISGILEFTLITFMIFSVFPALQKTIAHKEQALENQDHS